MPTLDPAKNREYVYRSRARALAAGNCKTCFRPREPERAKVQKAIASRERRTP